VIANDFSALAVALPAIEKQFDTDVGTVQWVINAYALTFGVLIVVGGRLAGHLRAPLPPPGGGLRRSLAGQCS